MRHDGPMHRLLRILAVALTTAGIVILVDAAVTLAWKEPVSAVYGAVEQNRAASEFEDLRDEFITAEDTERRAAKAASGGGVRREVRRLARRFENQVSEGDAIGRLGVPSMGGDHTILQGTDTDTLQKGPGRYPETQLPGQGGTLGIAGHRTTYGAPFRNINDVEAGDEIMLELPYARFTYEVKRTRIVEPTATHIVRDVGRERIVLTACHPLYSAEQRYAVFADLEDVRLAE